MVSGAVLSTKLGFDCKWNPPIPVAFGPTVVDTRGHPPHHVYHRPFNVRYLSHGGRYSTHTVILAEFLSHYEEF